MLIDKKGYFQEYKNIYAIDLLIQYITISHTVLFDSNGDWRDPNWWLKSIILVILYKHCMERSYTNVTSVCWQLGQYTLCHPSTSQLHVHLLSMFFYRFLWDFNCFLYFFIGSQCFFIAFYCFQLDGTRFLLASFTSRLQKHRKQQESECQQSETQWKTYLQLQSDWPAWKSTCIRLLIFLFSTLRTKSYLQGAFFYLIALQYNWATQFSRE